MILLKIRFFVAVAECGSFSQAARKLYTAQPNLSKQIAQMEQELGFTLFIRSRHQVRLTPAGAFLYEKLAQLPDRLDGYFDQARAMARREKGRLSIGVLEGQDVNQGLRCRLCSVMRTYPELDLTLERSSYRQLRSGLSTGHYDLIITLSFDVENTPQLELHTLYQKSPAVVMRRDHPLADRASITLRDLKDERFIVIAQAESPGGYQRLMDSCTAHGFKPQVVREPNSLESLLLYVEMGEGIAMLDQNTRLQLSPDIVTHALDAPPMAVVAVVPRSEQREPVRRVLQQLCPDNETGRECRT